jgi:hypothetical protein
MGVHSNEDCDRAHRVFAETCDAGPRPVEATLARTAVADRWLGIVQSVQPEDPTRFELVPNKLGSGLR